MASRKRKPKAAKQSRLPRLSFVGWLWLLALLNLIAGVMFSASTAPTRVVATGMRETDRGPVEKILSSYVKTPWSRLNVNEIRSRLSRADWVESAEFSPNIFGRATVHLTYRVPVAKLDIERPVYLDKSGSLYYDSLDYDVKKIKIPSEYMDESLTIVGDWPRSGIIDAIEELGGQLPQLDYSLELDAKSVLSLHIVDGPNVILGSPRKMDEKIKNLGKILSDPESGVDKNSRLNLMVPDRPMKSTK